MVATITAGVVAPPIHPLSLVVGPKKNIPLFDTSTTVIETLIMSDLEVAVKWTEVSVAFGPAIETPEALGLRLFDGYRPNVASSEENEN